MYRYTTTNSSAQQAESYPEFVRGTTPEFQYTMLDGEGDALDLSQFSTIKVTLAQRGSPSSSRSLTLTGDDIAVNGNVISFILKEYQSLKFSAGLISMQVFGQNSESRTWATLAEDVTIRVRKSLKDGDVIES